MHEACLEHTLLPLDPWVGRDWVPPRHVHLAVSHASMAATVALKFGDLVHASVGFVCWKLGSMAHSPVAGGAVTPPLLLFPQLLL